uniref:Palmitoyltransferase n=1 Tax=Branchiostoma floridae TaxID=7739 RepID=C3ZWI2_BRAFL|eukprot:XP_002587100.1 hypothetical protein BRAFLDRAFT_102617 [Branchiostoma floridae]
MAPRIDWRDLRRLCHWGPLVALFIIVYCYVMGVGCILIWWPPVTAAGVAHLIVYTAWELTILYNFFQAMLLGPGFVPLGWKPEKEEDCQFLQYCKQCQGYKSPRSHHCRKCKRCVMKMDHHCPWINTCCGHLNHTRFILFLLSAPLGCLHATVVYGCTMYRSCSPDCVHGVGADYPVQLLPSHAAGAGLRAARMETGGTMAPRIDWRDLRRLCHWGPLVALFIIVYCYVMGVGCILIWWPPVTAAGEGGRLPVSPVLCVMKMDHHCPWINTCCGHLNHTRFILFLLSAPLGCLHATVVYGCTMYRYLYLGSSYYYVVDDNDLEPLIDVDLYFFAMLFFATGLSIGVTVAVGILFSIQMKIVLTNQTGIETWILDKAKDRPRLEGDKFVYPYHLGWRRNFWEVFAWQGYPRGDGITWPVMEGCNQYTLTVEFAIVDNYSGSWFPITKGIRVCCCIPCTEEPRIKVKRGDVVMVTRAYRKWLYGEKVTRIKDGPPEKGWFPRPCAEKIINELHYPLQNQAADFEHDKKED